MANIKSFPNNQDVYIGAEDVMKWLHGRTSGVFAADGNASVSALVDPAMAVTVSDGLGWMANAGKDGVVWWIDNEAVNGAKLQLNIDPADGVLNRIDRIIVEWKTTNYVDYPEVKVLKGTASSKATAPALTNNSTARQISLAKISIAAGTTEITASMITDERLDPSVCGLVTENVSIDTSVMQNQFEELLTAIQKELQNLNAGTECLLKSSVVNNFTTTEEGYVADARALKTLNDSKLSLELLWENGSPTSDFGGNTITLDLSDYDGIFLRYKYGTTSGVYYTYLQLGLGSGVIFMTNSVNATNLYARSRNVKLAEVGVEIGTCYTHKYNDTEYSESNNYMIPFQIYGIKGVIA